MIVQNSQSKLGSFLFNDTRVAWFWFFVRVYVGYEWFMAGWEKLGADPWTGSQAGGAVKGFLMGALTKTAGAHPDVSMWYAWFINHLALPNAVIISYLVTYGEIIVGVALILGLFTGLAAFSGAFMNLNYLFAGTVSTNPLLLLLEFFLIVGWRVSGYIGLDYFIQPFMAKFLNKRR